MKRGVGDPEERTSRRTESRRGILKEGLFHADPNTEKSGREDGKEHFIKKDSPPVTPQC